MLRLRNITFLVLLTIGLSLAEEYINNKHPRPYKVRYYPMKTVFRKADLINKGCVVFIQNCPKMYKLNTVCARHYDGKYKTFGNYCEMEYENCNSWRKWSMIKRDRC